MYKLRPEDKWELFRHKILMEEKYSRKMSNSQREYSTSGVYLEHGVFAGGMTKDE